MTPPNSRFLGWLNGTMAERGASLHIRSKIWRTLARTRYSAMKRGLKRQFAPMKTVPRVTVITPFRNASAYLGEAIASVLGQTFEEWEHVLIDDGSTDDSLEIAKEFTRRDPRIKLVERTSTGSHGAAAARNAGMRAGSGAFFAFLDADDVFEPHMLDIVVTLAQVNPAAAMIFGSTRWWFPDGSDVDWVEPTDGLAGRLHAPPELLRRILLMQDGHVPCTCSVLVRRSAIDVVGGFEERFHLYEDQSLWAKLFLRYPVFVTPECLSRYRQHPGSVSAAANQQGLYDRMARHPARAAFLDWLAAHVADGNLRDAGVERALRLARAPYIEPASTKSQNRPREAEAVVTTWQVSPAPSAQICPSQSGSPSQRLTVHLCARLTLPNPGCAVTSRSSRIPGATSNIAAVST